MRFIDKVTKGVIGVKEKLPFRFELKSKHLLFVEKVKKNYGNKRAFENVLSQHVN